MSDYDFRSMNDKEFEVLCVEIVGSIEGRAIERFKPGRDGGVDGRYFASDGGEVVLQCKHWASTPTKQLISYMERVEVDKVKKISPKRYILAVSNELSRSDKKSISAAFHPYIVSDSDIYGREDLNDYIAQSSKIEQRHYKLWLASTRVLAFLLNNAIFGRSNFSIEEIRKRSDHYVVTNNHKKCMQKLKDFGVVIVTGAPGIGKTMLAENLCLSYVAREYRYVEISQDVREAEAVFDEDASQVFYFDDFLGRNYLDALHGHEGAAITKFIARVSLKKSNKKFILTSRSTILNQGKLLMDSFDHFNLQRNEFEIEISSLSDMDKAKILYSHLWHSGLQCELIDEIYRDRNYRDIIFHRNYNPRLINYITSSDRFENCSPDDYWKCVVDALENPTYVWENPFVAQQDDFGRAIVILVTFHGRRIQERHLSKAFSYYLSIPRNANFRGRSEFLQSTRLLSGSLLNRSVDSQGLASYDLFNPSIGDFVVNRYGADHEVLINSLLSLRSAESLQTIVGLEFAGFLDERVCGNLLGSVLISLSHEDFLDASSTYIASICSKLMVRVGNPSGEIRAAATRAIEKILREEDGKIDFDTLRAFDCALKFDLASTTDVLAFVLEHFSEIDDATSMEEARKLLSGVPQATPGLEIASEKLRSRVLEVLAENPEEFVAYSDAFVDVGYGEYDDASEGVRQMICEKLDSFGFTNSLHHADEIVEAIDVREALDAYFQRDSGDDEPPDAVNTLNIDEIDELFERTEL